jgi:thioredoxin reductase
LEFFPLTDVAIIGAGPYGLSLAAHLAKTKLSFRIFGKPMQSWAEKMPQRMHLKSEGFASDLFSPGDTYTLEHFCTENNLPYGHVGNAVDREVFVAYGQEFQRRLVPSLELVDISHVAQIPGGFELTTATGETLQARKVIVAAGISHFDYTPPILSTLPPHLLSHSLDVNDVADISGKKLAVIGAGSSAIDVAAFLHEEGAEVHLIGRRGAIYFHTKSHEPRPLLDRIRQPRSALGLGWKSRLACDIPRVFARLPLKLRLRAVERHLGPAPGWFMRERFVNRVTMHLSTQLKAAEVKDGKAALTFTEADGSDTTLTVDHVIAATGFKARIERLKFLSSDILGRIAVIEQTGTAVLKDNFESTVPGLFFVGLAASTTFGPVLRFSCGAEFTAKHLSRSLSKGMAA